jgi:hypothetical protein
MTMITDTGKHLTDNSRIQMITQDRDGSLLVLDASADGFGSLVGHVLQVITVASDWNRAFATVFHAQTMSKAIVSKEKIAHDDQNEGKVDVDHGNRKRAFAKGDDVAELICPAANVYVDDNDEEDHHDDATTKEFHDGNGTERPKNRNCDDEV